MIFYLALFLLCWSMIFTAGKFLRYYKIYDEYKQKTTAVVIKSELCKDKSIENKSHKKKELNVILEYCIDGKIGHSEIRVPFTQEDQYNVGKEIPICYMVSGNGAVHIASDTEYLKKIMIGHGIAVVVEILFFVIIWVQML